jgi:hypothetical protein
LFEKQLYHLATGPAHIWRYDHHFTPHFYLPLYYQLGGLTNRSKYDATWGNVAKLMANNLKQNRLDTTFSTLGCEKSWGKTSRNRYLPTAPNSTSRMHVGVFHCSVLPGCLHAFTPTLQKTEQRSRLQILFKSWTLTMCRGGIRVCTEVAIVAAQAWQFGFTSSLDMVSFTRYG